MRSPRGILRQSEALKGIYGCFSLADPDSGLKPWERNYIERKAMELTVTGITLNICSKNHIGERTTDKFR